MGVIELFRVGPLGPEFPMKSHIQAAAIQPDLWVDPYGERFCDEGIAFFDTSVGNVNARFKEGYTWSLIDDSIKNTMIAKGIARNFSTENPPGARLVNFEKELKAVLGKGTKEIIVADSVEELAAGMGVDPVVSIGDLRHELATAHSRIDELVSNSFWCCFILLLLYLFICLHISLVCVDGRFRGDD